MLVIVCQIGEKMDAWIMGEGSDGRMMDGTMASSSCEHGERERRMELLWRPPSVLGRIH